MRTIAAALSVLFIFACTSPTDHGQPCTDPPYFTVLPIALEDIRVITVIGGLGAPGHTLPTAHAGIYLARENVTVRSPGAIEVTTLRRTRYVVSPSRQGESDYAVEYRVCRDVTGWFGHVTSLAPTFNETAIDWDNCSSYRTADETVEQCRVSSDLRLAAGDLIGTAGMSAARGLLGFDVGLLDARIEHFYVSPQRFPPPTFHAICPWEQYASALRELLFGKLMDPSRPATPASGTPRCGTMEVDVAGTAKGVWVEQGVTGQVGGDERRYITLADYPYRPQENLALSLGPTTLGATVGQVTRATSGRVNRAFEQVTGDGTVYCYGPSLQHPSLSWFVALSAAGQLSIERRLHSAGASPCLADPSTWSFSASRVTMVR